MIRHSIQLVEWLRGLGASQTLVSSDDLEIDANVKMVADLSNGPGHPLGVMPSTSTHISTVTSPGVGEFAVYMFSAGGGGAWIYGMQCEAIPTNGGTLATSVIWNSFDPAGLGLAVGAGEGTNVGGRQFDRPPADIARSRANGFFGFRAFFSAGPFPLINPTGAAAAPEHRADQGISIGRQVLPMQVYVPPGELIGLLCNPVTTELEATFYAHILPLRSTSLAR